MKIAAFIGSGNRNGNTATVVRQVLSGASTLGAEGELHFLCEYHIKPCTGCRACEKSNRCVITDDDTHILHKAIREADAFIIATPTYYGDITGAFKQFVDRCYPFCVQDINKETRVCKFDSILPPGKLGLFVGVSGGQGVEVFECHKKVAFHCFNDLNVTYWRNILVPHTTFEPVRESHPVLEESWQCGIDMVTESVWPKD
jgi:multimeric flavodoxin WrbA